MPLTYRSITLQAVPIKRIMIGRPAAYWQALQFGLFVFGAVGGSMTGVFPFCSETSGRNGQPRGKGDTYRWFYSHVTDEAPWTHNDKHGQPRDHVDFN